MDLFDEIGAIHRFRDPIYGYILLTDSEIKIIDTPIFQRLRRIQQLALTKYVYPTAEHTRFVHSLGVLQCASNIFRWVWSKYKEILIGDWEKESGAKELKMLRFASLLHDVGHLPFSHAAERQLLPQGKSHEDISALIVEHYPKISEIIRDSNIEPRAVAGLISGEYPKRYNILKQILSDEFDADRADYLLRDSYFCGVSYGTYDFSRFMMAFKLIKGETGSTTIAIDEADISVIESFLLARFHYNMQVPYHRTRVGYDLSLKKYIKILDENKEIPALYKDGEFNDFDFDVFSDFDDYFIFNLIKRDYNKNFWGKVLNRMDHIRPVYDKTAQNNIEKLEFGRIVNALDNNGLEREEDYFYHSKDLEVHKLSTQTDEDESDDNQLKVMNKNEEITGYFLNRSTLMSSLAKNPVHLQRIYVKPEKEIKSKEIIETAMKQFQSDRKIGMGGK